MGYNFLFFKNMRLAYHGNYVGPGWSAGRFQDSVANSDVPAIDEFDQTGKEHDAAYAPTADPSKRNAADTKFAQANFGRGFKRTAAAMAVGAQELIRRVTFGAVDLSGHTYSSTSFPQKDSGMSKKRKLSNPNAPPTPKRASTSRSVAAQGGSTSRSIATQTSGGGRSAQPKPYPSKRRRRGRGKGKRKRRKGKRRSARMQIYQDRYGAVEKTENGGVVGADRNGALYIGHACPTKTLANVVLCAIVKKMFDEAGIKFADWKESIGLLMGYARQHEYLRLTAYYRKDEEGLDGEASKLDCNVRIYNGAAVTTATFRDFVTQFQNVVQTVELDVNKTQSFTFISFTLSSWNGYNDDSREQVVLSVVMGEQMKIELGYSSSIRIQNRTNDASNSNVLDTNSQNPLIAKLYTQRKEWANGFSIAKTAIKATTFNTQNLFSNGATGLIKADDTFQPDNFKKLPAPWVLGASSAKTFVHQPGVIQSFKHSWKASMNLNTIFQKMPNVFFSDLGVDASSKVLLGNAQLVGYELALHDRTETTNIVVSWEINNTCHATIKPKRIRTLPMLTVGTAIL